MGGGSGFLGCAPNFGARGLVVGYFRYMGQFRVWLGFCDFPAAVRVPRLVEPWKLNQMEEVFASEGCRMHVVPGLGKVYFWGFPAFLRSLAFLCPLR